MKRTLLWMMTPWLFWGVAGCSSGDGAQREPLPEERVERALQAFGVAVREDAPVVHELDRALAARLTNAKVGIIVQQFLRVIAAAGRHERVEPDPEFVALVQELSDLPYFNEFARALSGDAGTKTSALRTNTRGIASVKHALTSPPSCKSDCSLDVVGGYLKDVGLSVLGALVPEFGLVANGIACGDQITALYACANDGSCGRLDLASLGSSCLQVGATLATLGKSKMVVGIVGVAGALVGGFAGRWSVDNEVARCEAYQEANCCIGLITCGAGCCEQGFACLPTGLCARNSVAGCNADEKLCGIYCCPAGSLCDATTTTCRPAAVCTGTTSACGANCCEESQTCDGNGMCRDCDAALLCGGTVCCGVGRFCNVVGQCLREPDVGCGPICGTGCCVPGQACVEGACVGEPAVCPDGTCDAQHESPLICPADCPSQCGDGFCQPWEIAATCALDCDSTSAVDAGVPSADTGTSTGCGEISCGVFCDRAEAKALRECAEQGGTVVSPFDSAACLSSCACLIGDCPGLLPCVLDITCPGCEAVVVGCDEQLLYTCDWGGWLKCGRTL